MRAFFTPLLILVPSCFWAQAVELPFTQTPPEVIAVAAAAWSASQSVEAEDPAEWSRPGYAFSIASTRSTILSVQDGSWSDAATWDCACVPVRGDNVVIEHNVTLSQNVEFTSLIVDSLGSLVDEMDVTLTFDGHFLGLGAVLLEGTHVVADNIAGYQNLGARMTVDNLSALNRTTLHLNGTIEVTGNVTVDNSTIDVVNSAELILSQNEVGRATVTRPNGGAIEGKVTRRIVLPAIPNRTMSFVEQRISTGLEGVTVSELIGDIPTWGFEGADDPNGFANIGHWSADALYNYQAIQNATDTLPVWEGIYIALAPAESYTLTFAGTLPATDVTMDIPGNALSALFGNATNANADLQFLNDQVGQGKLALDCWNTNTLQYDHFANGVSTNGLSSTLQPNTTCQLLPSENLNLMFGEEATMPNGEWATSTAELEGIIGISATNESGYRDEIVLAIRENTSVSYVTAEDALNTSSLYSACDLYLRDAAGNRNAIAQLDFDFEPTASFDLVLAANRPLDGNYTIAIEESNWFEGCAYIVFDGETEYTPLEVGELTTVELNSDQNYNFLIGTVHLIPPTRAEVSSPGCEGQGTTYIEVFPTGEGPWSVSLFDANGEVVEGVTNDNGVSVMFNNLFSGTYTYQVVNDGALSCGTMVEEHTVIRPTKMTVTTEVSADCGEGGQAVADVFATASGVEYAWSDGQTGPIATELPAGFYKLIVTNEFECKDTVEVEILAAPELQILATDGECDGSVNSAIELNCDDNTAHWDVNIRNANGNLVDFAYNVSLPMFFDILATGSYQVETELRGDWGCPPATQEVSIVQPVPMTLEATSEVQCDGDQLGTASTTMIGGVGYIQYQWSDGQQGPDAEGLQAGTYTVIATDEAGCSESVDVLVDLSPQMTVTPLSPGCEGEGETGFQLEGAPGVTWTIQVTDNAGNTVETLTLPGGLAEITGMESGTYIVETSHDVANGCPAQQVEAQLIQPSDMTVETTTTPMQCGEVDAAAIELNVQGGSGAVTVTWDHGASGTSLSNLAGGQYYAVVEDSNGCTKDVRVEIEETPTVEANFEAPTGGLTDGFSGMTLTFTNTSEGNVEGQTWYFGDTDVPSYDYHATHTFEEAGAFDVFLNVWNEQCSHTVRKTVVVSHGETDLNDDELGAMVTHVMEGDLSVIPAPITTETGWMLDLGAVSSGMMVHVYDLTGRQLCNPAMADANGQIWVEGDEWPALVLLRLVHEPTNSIRTWKMVRQ